MMNEAAPHRPERSKGFPDDFQAARIVHIRIQPDRAIVDVAIDAQAPARTTFELAARAIQLRPNLPHHTCVNAPSRAGQANPVFSSVMDDTPLPHLLEHLVIDVLTEMFADDSSAPRQAAADPSASRPAAADPSARRAPTFVGTSEWLDRAARIARIEVSCPDDLLVLRAFAEALHLLNVVVVG